MFSKATEYALRATIYIAQKGTEEKKIGIDEIAKAIGSPQSFTAKILQALSRNNRIIGSATGPNGGFYMSEKARKMPVRVVLEAMNEDDLLNKCILGLSRCSETKPCPMHAQYKQIKEQLIRLFETKTIQRLADDIKTGEVFINYRNK
ncbi:MAG: Rrf2 family transcriptional regulator [Bacteroidota bacterium]|nr:Rrf2 family transcriptional regulator [Bacteroidota bacterium]